MSRLLRCQEAVHVFRVCRELLYGTHDPPWYRMSLDKRKCDPFTTNANYCEHTNSVALSVLEKTQVLGNPRSSPDVSQTNSFKLGFSA